jgi:hypothetical protein
MSEGKRVLNIVCSSCGLTWTDEHRCPVPPPIDTTRYSDEALRRLADYLLRVLADRAKVAS